MIMIDDDDDAIAAKTLAKHKYTTAATNTRAQTEQHTVIATRQLRPQFTDGIGARDEYIYMLRVDKCAVECRACLFASAERG